MTLWANEGKKITAGAIAKAEELNIKVCVSLCDGGGRLVAFCRMDGAIWAAGYRSQGKATARPLLASPGATFSDAPTRLSYAALCTPKVAI